VSKTEGGESVSIQGKTVVITGGSSGIGAAAARHLAQRGANVVITGRSQATEKIAREIGCDHYLVDFAKLAEVRKLASWLLEKYPRIDVLANNAGAIFGERRLTEDGHEMTFQINHLAGFLLTWLLRERLEASRATIINTSSVANNFGRVDLNDLENTKNYDPFRAYGTGKLMNILHAIALNEKLKNVNAVSFHPGGVATSFAREGSGLIKWVYENAIGRFFLISPEKGADTLNWLAESSPGSDWKPGEYYVKRKLGRRNPQVAPDLARNLWEASLQILGEKK
jgi:NAD(P)-dependent dehydrogenase (short-subunit alcohol dehydrogenase family)